MPVYISSHTYREEGLFLNCSVQGLPLWQGRLGQYLDQVDFSGNPNCPSSVEDKLRIPT